MESRKHWRVAPTRSGRVHRRSNRRPSLRAAVAAGAVVAVALPVLSADAAVGGRRSIEVHHGSGLVLLQGYPARTRVKIQVLRNGTVIGFATKRTDGTGAIEMNHDGRAGGDCFESPNTPDFQPRDLIRTTILSNGVRDTSYVRGVWIDTEPGTATTTITGRVRLGTGATAVRPGTDVLELRVRTDGGDVREDILPGEVDGDGNWSHEMGGVTAAEVANGEVVLEWSGPADVPDEITVAEQPAPAVPADGCPPIGP